MGNGFELKNVNRYLQTFCSFLCRGIGPSGTVAISDYIYQHCCNIVCLGLYIAALWQYRAIYTSTVAARYTPMRHCGNIA